MHRRRRGEADALSRRRAGPGDLRQGPQTLMEKEGTGALNFYLYLKTVLGASVL